MPETRSLFEDYDDPEYKAFVEKFKPKKTTDDCYTPPNVYDAVAEWVANEYNIDRADFVRPFYPGEDYKLRDYPEGCVVVDNPPFSILAEIIAVFVERGVKFFLFAPALTLFGSSVCGGVCGIATGATITYENGSEIPTSFRTNLERDCVARTAPSLYEAIKRANDDNLAKIKRSVPKYSYPDNVVTAAIAQRWCHYGVDWRLSPSECVRVSALDAQLARGKSIFGGGLLLSERAAAERAAAERAAAERWELSEREKRIIKNLGTGGSK